MTVDVSLKTPSVFVHEAPRLTLRIVAPKGRELRMLRPGIFHQYPGALQITLYNPNGELVTGGLPTPAPPLAQVPAHHMLEVPAGRQLEFSSCAAVSPQIPGRHRLHVEFEPEWPNGRVYKEDLFLNVHELDGEAIMKRIALESDGEQPPIQILTVRTEEQAVLLHWNPDYSIVKRVCEIPLETKVSARVLDASGRPEWRDVLITLDNGDRLDLLSVSYETGTPRRWTKGVTPIMHGCY